MRFIKKVVVGIGGGYAEYKNRCCTGNSKF